jgi:uncharacterized flavoprotein (TIGR03862 family)
MLRAWLHRLKESGVRFHMRHKWLGWAAQTGNATASARSTLRFATPTGEQQISADAVVLALGGASWPRLGSDAAWVPLLGERGVRVAPLRPSNCGFDANWSSYFRERFAGQPVKPVAITLTAPDGGVLHRQGEFVVTATGIEGSLVYALSAPIRDRLQADGEATITLDLLPDFNAQRVFDEVTRPRGSRSMSTHLQSRAGITGVKLGLLYEALSKEEFADTACLARTIKALPLKLVRTRPIEEAISSAGGVPFEALTAALMLRNLPGVFCAGEMLDWEAPTGGYLLTACFASGLVAGRGALDYLNGQ